MNKTKTIIKLLYFCFGENVNKKSRNQAIKFIWQASKNITEPDFDFIDNNISLIWRNSKGIINVHFENSQYWMNCYIEAKSIISRGTIFNFDNDGFNLMFQQLMGVGDE